MSTTTTKIWAGVATAAAVAALAFTGTASASEGDETGTTTRDRTELCARLDDFHEFTSDRLAEIEHRIGYLTTQRDRLAEAGRDDLVARIDAGIERLHARAERVQDRVEKVDAWAAEHCS